MVEFSLVKMTTSTHPALTSRCAKQAEKIVARAAEAAGVACEMVHVEHEHPYQGIIDTAGSKGCDLIVMASHGRTASPRSSLAARRSRYSRFQDPGTDHR